MGSDDDTNTLSILLVQDDRPTAFAWARHFHGVCGFPVYVAFNGFTALQVIAERRLDIVIVDMGLPHPDGFAIAQRSREQSAGKGPFLIAVTGKQGAEFRRRAEEARFDLYLIKPVDIQRLHRLLMGSQGTSNVFAN
jgi:DNA-binding response OmpR family regulator